VYTSSAHIEETLPMKASILDLRRRMSEVLRALEKNETVTILHRGKPKGTIYPAGGKGRTLPVVQHLAFGMWKDREDLADVARTVRDLRKGRGHAL
jgi:antitoxin (DNA-binding transcriptional repressor) of toxin-antitoxin stability system